MTSALNRYGPFSEAVIRRYTGQVLTGLEYLHNNRIMHRDIKGSNLLIDHGIIKLADFGCSKRLAALPADGDPEDELHTAVGTTQCVGWVFCVAWCVVVVVFLLTQHCCVVGTWRLKSSAAATTTTAKPTFGR